MKQVIKEIIENNLLSQIGNFLKKRLEEAEFSKNSNFKNYE